MATQTAPIGVFDSGMGGLTVLKALREALPNEDFIYLGDTARLPYGTKAPSTVVNYALQAARTLVSREVKAIVVACNTASGLALPELSKAFDPLPVYGVVLPGAVAAIQSSQAQSRQNGGVLVLATESTVAGGAYQRALLDISPGLSVRAHACPLWVTLAEMGEQSNRLTDEILCHELRGDLPSTVLLGCTHFPVFNAKLKDLFPTVRFVDSADTTAEWVAKDLAEQGLLQSKARSGQSEFLATDGVARFIRVGSYFLHADIEHVELVDL
jgi:glutamate racemase